MRAALDAALIRADIIAGARLLAAIAYGWSYFGHRREAGARILSFAAQLPLTETLLRAQLLDIHAMALAEDRLLASGLAVAADAEKAARESGDGPTLAAGLVRSAEFLTASGDVDAAKRALDEADAIPGTST